MAVMTRIVALCLLLCAPAGFAQPCPDDPKATLQSLLSNAEFQAAASSHFGGLDLKGRDAVIVAWNHVEDLWSIYDWDAAKESLARRNETRVDGGNLQVAAPSGRQALMFVTHTNPLIYSGKALAITTTPTDEVAALQKLATLLGASITGIVQQRESTRTASRLPTECTVDEEWEDALQRLGEASTHVASLAETVALSQSRAISYMQVVELGVRPATPFENIVSDPAGTIAKIDREFSALDAARQEVVAPMPCRKVAEAAKSLIEFVKANPAADRKQKIDELTKTLTDCTPRDLSRWEEAIGAGLDLSCFNQLAGYLDGYRVREQADTLLTKRAALFKSAAWLHELESTARLYGGRHYDPCRYINGVLAIRGGNIEAVLDEQNTGGFNLTATPPVTDFVTARPNPVERKINVTSTMRWGLGAGVVYTPLDDLTWTAVPDPDDPSRKVIGEPTRTTRAGQIALLANVSPAWARLNDHIRGGLQFGAGASTDEPALFLGLSADLGRWFRIGGGVTWQRVKRLEEGQEELVTEVTDDKPIRLRDSFPPDWYVALTLSIDGIPLFNVD